MKQSPYLALSWPSTCGGRAVSRSRSRGGRGARAYSSVCSIAMFM